MFKINKRAAAITAAIGVCVALVAAAPANADTTAPSSDQTLGLDYVSGDTVGDVLITAVQSQGAAFVSDQLEQLAQAAGSGTQVSFPGLENLDPAQVEADLESAAAAIAAGQAVPDQVASLVVEPAAQFTPAPSEPSTSANAPQVQAAAASDWTTYMANTPQEGAKLDGGRTWGATATMSHSNCGIINCTLVDKWTVRVNVTPQHTTSLFQVQSTHIIAGSVVGTPKLTLRGFRIHSVVEIRNSNVMAAGAHRFTVANSPSLSFLQNEASYYFHVFGSGTSHGAHDVKWRTPVAECGTEYCSW